MLINSKDLNITIVNNIKIQVTKNIANKLKRKLKTTFQKYKSIHYLVVLKNHRNQSSTIKRSVDIDIVTSLAA